MKAALEIRQQIANEEFDHVALQGLLRRYARPRDKITQLLAQDLIQRVKKGLYVFGPALARAPYSRETLANLIYGPSYLSFEYALSFYNLIPERVVPIASATTKRSKTFRTPHGVFRYQHISPRVFALGVVPLYSDPRHQILMASVEKALADLVALGHGALPEDFADGRRTSSQTIEEYLFDNLRIDKSELQGKMNGDAFQAIALAYRNRTVTALAGYFKSWGKPI